MPTTSDVRQDFDPTIWDMGWPPFPVRGNAVRLALARPEGEQSRSDPRAGGGIRLARLLAYLGERLEKNHPRQREDGAAVALLHMARPRSRPSFERTLTILT